MVELKRADEIEKMAEAGKIVALALQKMRQAAKVGMTLKELDAVAVDVLTERDSGSPFLQYQPSWASVPFPGVICASVNDAVVHGIPGDYELQDGDLLSVDFGAIRDGWCADAALSFSVGTAREEDAALLRDTREALQRGIEAAVEGNTTGDIAYAIGSTARAQGYGILADHGGHGVGRNMHEEPHILNDGEAGSGVKLQTGMVIAIQPMLIAGGRDDYTKDDDGWTLRTADGSRAAHFEHTIAITPEGPRILTALD